MPQELTPPRRPLSLAERQAVTMLGDGHTAKSIARELGISVNAVNERLREARRKTGLGSSREVARWLKAEDPQETWDEQIGIEQAPVPAEHGGFRRILLMCRERPKEVLAMSLLLVIASAAVLTVPAMQHPRGNAARSEEAVVDTGDARLLHDRVEKEPVDQKWMEPAQRRLESIYSAIPSLGCITVHCATTLCELTGLIAADGRDRAIDSLRAPSLVTAVRAAGFDRELATSFRDSSDDNGVERSAVTVFAAYWSRQTGIDVAPRVIATSPAHDATITPGSIVLSVTFDHGLVPRPQNSDMYH
ncbi:helix-turn-helix transcriptional regulator [Sphingomonas sp. UYEF23]|uniref:helix-turn-helix domain-containing protein n=1 Tax=Sphingomonas sp. UYEF23 TaxID=1756408 RepID=UPI003395F82A